MKISNLILLLTLITTSALRAESTQTPISEPDFMTPTQLAAWSQQKHEKAMAAHATQAAATQSAPGVFYTGKPYLAESGTYSFLARQYNPEMARWTTVDPSGFPDGPNNRVYAAVPTAQMDSTGEYIVTPLNLVPGLGDAINLWNGFEAAAALSGNSLIVTAMGHAESGKDWANDPALNTAVQASSLYQTMLVHGNDGGVYGNFGNQIAASIGNGSTHPTSATVTTINTAFLFSQDTQLYFALHAIAFNSFTANIGWNQNKWSASGTVGYSKTWDFSHHLSDFLSWPNSASQLGADAVNADGILLQQAGLISSFQVSGSFADTWKE